MLRTLAAALAALSTLLLSVASGHGQTGVASTSGNHGRTQGASSFAARAAQPPFADPQELVNTYYQQLADSMNRREFAPLVAFFAPDAGIDSGLAAGGASGSAEILTFFRKVPAVTGFTVELSNLQEDDPYVDVDWRWRGAPGSLRGYLDGHDSFKIQDGLIASLEQQVDAQAAAEAFMPPPLGPLPRAMPVARSNVRMMGFKFAPQVIQVAVGTMVSWTNYDADSHAVTTVDRAMDTGVIEEAVSATLTFSAAGTYQYYCTIHPGMRGTVIVGDAAPVGDLP